MVALEHLDALRDLGFVIWLYLVLEWNIARYSVENFLVIFAYCALQSLLCEEVLNQLKDFDDLVVGSREIGILLDGLFKDLDLLSKTLDLARDLLALVFVLDHEPVDIQSLLDFYLVPALDLFHVLLVVLKSVELKA